MFTTNGQKCLCDAEIGSVKNGWHSCRKPAVVSSESNPRYGYILLHWCEQHRERASAEGRHNVKILSKESDN